MIQANELRIGNLVQTEYEGVVEVININSEGFDYIDMRKPTYKAIGRIELSYVNGIPLTEEWLIRFGFIDNEYTMELDGLILGWGSRIVSTKQRNSWSCQDYPHIEYVHQLQNLYFALTQTELTLKDNV